MPEATATRQGALKAYGGFSDACWPWRLLASEQSEMSDRVVEAMQECLKARFMYMP